MIQSAECNTDHNLLALKYRLSAMPCFRQPSVVRTRIATSKLRHEPVDGEPDIRAEFAGQLGTALADSWPSEPSVDSCWQSISKTVVDVARQCLGHEKRQTSDWFTENRHVIEPVLIQRDDSYQKWKQTGRISDQVAYKQARSSARRTIRSDQAPVAVTAGSRM